MSYSRRKLLRDGAVSCLASAVSTSIPLIGCKPESQRRQSQGTPPVSRIDTAFSQGIRVFFIGAWLFTPDPDNPSGRILALTLDLDIPMHGFPFGPYKANFNKGKDLNATGTSSKYNVLIDTTSAATVTSLFRTAAEDQTFMWIPGLKIKQDKDLATVSKYLRKISVPLPNRIVTADFLEGSDVSAQAGLLHRAVPSIPGAPSAFIFDYQNATTLATDFGAPPLTAGITSDSDFHFRVVPKWDEKCPDYNHAAKMFNYLVSNLVEFNGAQPPTLDVQNAGNVKPGSNIPKGVTDDELDIAVLPQGCNPYPPGTVQGKSLKTASCAGGGGGIGSAP